VSDFVVLFLTAGVCGVAWLLLQLSDGLLLEGES
jgi:hypothetical protein